MPSFDYDMIVIGGGAAGFIASKLARGLGKRVAMIEKNKLGGECTNSGCIPSKALIRTARIAHEFRRLGDFGLAAEGARSLDTGNVMAHVRAVVQKVSEEHPAGKFEQEGIKVLFGSPQFQDDHTIALGGRTLSSKKFIIATGSSAFIPPIDGVDAVPYLTNDTLFQREKLPASLIVLGGGPIGIELASALNRLGVKVTVVEMLDRILFKEDRELVEMLASRLLSEGVRILVSAKAVKFSRSEGNLALTVEQGGRRSEVVAESVLIAVGRKPNNEGLALEQAGVQYTGKGIVTDETLRTSARHIYACGDVVGPYQFSHMAEYQAVIACLNAFLPISRKADYRHVAWTTFTDPELARAGLTEEEARTRFGSSITVYRHDYGTMDRAVTDGEEFGMAKYICDRRGRLVGAHILGSHATEVMHEAQLAKTLGVPFSKIRRVIHAYPSYSDAVREPSKKRAIDELQNNLFVKLLRKLLPKR